MAKTNLPSPDFDLSLAPGRQKAMIDTATGKRTEYMVRVDQLQVLPGFNVRVRETEDYRSHVEALKQSIRVDGFYSNKPITGFISKDGDSDVIYVTDGHTRLEAVQEINSEALDAKEEIEALPVTLKAADSSMADLTIALAQDNTGRPLTPFEMGVVVQRLANLKDAEGNPTFTKADIAKRLSITERYIDDLNVLSGASNKVRDAVVKGSISSTLAIQELRRDPKKAEERLTTAVTKAAARGKTKATKKDVGVSVKMMKVRHSVSLATGDSIKDALKALASQVRGSVGHDSDDVLVTDGTISVVIEVPAPEKPAPTPKVAPKAKAPAPKVAPKAKAPAKAQAKPAAKKASPKKPSKPTKAAADDEDGELTMPAPPKIDTVAGVEDPNDI